MIFFYSTFKKLMVPLLPTEPIQGRLLRARFNEVSGRTIGGVNFYLWMHRLRDEGLVVVNRYRDADGLVLTFRRPNPDEAAGT